MPYQNLLNVVSETTHFPISADTPLPCGLLEEVAFIHLPSEQKEPNTINEEIPSHPMIKKKCGTETGEVSKIKNISGRKGQKIPKASGYMAIVHE